MAEYKPTAILLEHLPVPVKEKALELWIAENNRSRWNALLGVFSSEARNRWKRGAKEAPKLEEELRSLISEHGVVRDARQPYARQYGHILRIPAAKLAGYPLKATGTHLILKL